MDELKLLGLAIKATREANGLSMRELADRAQLAPSTVSVVESGARDPNFNTLVAMCKVLGTKPSALLALADKLGRRLPEIERRRAQMRHDKEELARLTDALSSQVASLLATK